MQQHLAMLRDWFQGAPRQIWSGDNPVGTETLQRAGMPQPTVYAGPVGQFINPATGQMTEQGQARMDNPAMNFDTGGIGVGTVPRAIPPAFRDWFGASKVATPEGMPLQVYHGTNAPGFEVFDPSTAGGKTGNVTTPLGHFFTDQPNEASRYATSWGAEGGNVRPAYLSLQNPYEMPKSEFDKLAMSVFRGEKTEPEAMAHSAGLRQQLIDQGHDGIVIPGSGKGRPTEYVAFHPEQIAPSMNVDAASPGFRAYHGSPHAFDQFDLSKIGTGEGAQAYGHGMYLADAEGVARGYRDQLAKMKIGDVPISEAAVPAQTAAGQNAYGSYNLASLARKGVGDIDPKSVIAAYVHDYGDPSKAILNMREDGLESHANMARDMLKSGELSNAGHMYEVQVNADPAHFLDWDKPLSEQHPVVQQALMSHGIDNPKLTGQDAYTEMAGTIPNGYLNEQNLPHLISEKLRVSGVPGIRYLDAGSRGAGEGSRNSVVFSPEKMEIIRKYGLAGLMAGGGAAVGLRQDQTPSGGDQP